MKRLIDPNHVSAVPKCHTDPSNGHKIFWDSVRFPFPFFLNQVRNYYAGNNREAPSDAELQNEICNQLPGWNCTGDPNYHAPSRTHAAPSQRSGGCKSCGKR